ncbi:nucleotidyltransferase [Dethiothermospora halolimnae]|uniref:nucleotidyltransferase n=1 Tax=Dethiothermospora halolimnae TaxID=3114390 RepID=UPI003CCC43C5
MKVVGLVTEYNPFHNGHMYHLNKAKEITDSDFSVAIMSGNFLQRGEPALLDKWTRTKMAIDNGVDLVIELPVIYACQSAEYFAYGAIRLLDSLGVVDYLCFGSELGETENLNKIATILNNEPKDFKLLLKEHLDKGLPFPKARTNAIIDYIKKSNENISMEDIINILSNPNNILGVEYLKALNKINSKIVPTTIKRKSAQYNSISIEGNIASATAIRKKLLDNDISIIKNTVPNITYHHLIEALKKYNSFNSLKNYNDLLLYLIRTTSTESIKELLDVDEGLENRIIEFGSKYNEINKILDGIKTKRYTYTRLQRIMMHLLLGLDKNKLFNFYKEEPLYIRVLGFNKKGIKILNKAKKVSSFPIITKFANYKNINNSLLHKVIQYDKRATDIYYLGLKKFNNKKTNLDYLISPYFNLN